MTLEERVRDLIGRDGPQLDRIGYEARIDQELHYMSRADFLSYLSRAFEYLREEDKPI